VEALAVLSEELQAMSDGRSRAAEQPCGLAMGHLRDEGADEGPIEPGLLEAVVEAEGLGGKGAAALETEESLDGSAVAGAGKASLKHQR
jgi:hypothetical protein